MDYRRSGRRQTTRNFGLGRRRMIASRRRIAMSGPTSSPFEGGNITTIVLDNISEWFAGDGGDVSAEEVRDMMTSVRSFRSFKRALNDFIDDLGEYWTKSSRRDY